MSGAYTDRQACRPHVLGRSKVFEFAQSKIKRIISVVRVQRARTKIRGFNIPRPTKGIEHRSRSRGAIRSLPSSPSRSTTCLSLAYGKIGPSLASPDPHQTFTAPRALGIGALGGGAVLPLSSIFGVVGRHVGGGGGEISAPQSFYPRPGPPSPGILSALTATVTVPRGYQRWRGGAIIGGCVVR